MGGQPPQALLTPPGRRGIVATLLESGSEHLTLRPWNLGAHGLTLHMVGAQHPHAMVLQFGTSGQSLVPQVDLRPPAPPPFLTAWICQLARGGCRVHPSWGGVGVCDTDKYSALITLAPEKRELL